jgi:hypothetical protein
MCVIIFVSSYYLYSFQRTTISETSAHISQDIIVEKHQLSDESVDSVLAPISMATYFDKQPLWNHELDLDTIENMLVEQPIVSAQKMSEYCKEKNKKYSSDNAVILVTLKNGLKAVFKTDEDRFAEVAAYRASTVLGLRLVPPTVFKKYNGQKGSLQFFIDTDIDLLDDPSYLAKIDPKTISDMKLFYFIFGQWDINRGNQIIQKCKDDYFLALIDNAGMINLQQVCYGDFPFVRRGYSDNRKDSWDAPFPFNTATCLKNPTFEDIDKLLDFMSQDEKLKYYNRCKDGSITYCFWRNALWIQYYKNTPEVTPNYIDDYYQDTLEAYKKLDTQVLQDIWKESYKVLENKKTDKLVDAICARRDQVLQHAQMKVSQNTMQARTENTHKKVDVDLV